MKNNQTLSGLWVVSSNVLGCVVCIWGVCLGVYLEVWASVATNGETAPVRSRSSRTWKHFYQVNLGKLELSNQKKRKEGEKKEIKIKLNRKRNPKRSCNMRGCWLC